MSITSARKKVRDSLLLGATAEFADGTHCKATVRNTSAGGVRLKSAVIPKKGEVLWLHLLNVGRVSAEVTWTAEGEFGAAFRHELDPSAIRRKQVA